VPAGLFIKHGDVGTGIRVTHEALRLTEIVLGTNANYLYEIFVVLSKLLKVARMGSTGWSMRRPVPEQHWPVAGDDLAQGGDRTVGDGQHLAGIDRLGVLEEGSVLGGSSFCSCGFLAGYAATTGGGEQRQ